MTYKPDSSTWFPTIRCKSSARLRLFCFPYAGGNSAAFRSWPQYFPESVEICPVQLPGRGARFLESPIKKFPLLIDAIVNVIKPFLDEPFAFFGHSLGSLIAFEITHQLGSDFSLQPIHLIVSGCSAPSHITQRQILSKLSDRELVDELRQLNGTPSELLNNKELMAMVLPGLRADFALYESYRYKPRRPLECPLTVFGGTEDRTVDSTQLELWSEETKDLFSLYQLPGNHFFLHNEEATVLMLILQKLKTLIHKVA